MGVYMGQGLLRLLDQQQRFVRNARPTSLRLRNFTSPTGLYAQLGYVITPSGGPSGTTDVLIDPTPSMKMVSMYNIANSNGKLRMGAREYLISATFVNAQQMALGLARPELVFFGGQTVGLYADSQLFEIVNAFHEEISGQSISWTVTANAPEQLK